MSANGPIAISQLGALRRWLDDHQALQSDPTALGLVPILTSFTEISSAGFAFLNPHAFSAFRDNIAHLLSHGNTVLEAATKVMTLTADWGPLDGEDRASMDRAHTVVRTMINTAAVTAPPDLWLLRLVLGVFSELGLADRLLAGEVVDPNNCWVPHNGDMYQLDSVELLTNLELLHARGYIQAVQGRYLLASHPRAREVVQEIQPTAHSTSRLTPLWTRLFGGNALDSDEIALLEGLAESAPTLVHDGHIGWLASSQEVELGYRTVPVVLALRVNGHTVSLAKGERLSARQLNPHEPSLVATALNILVKSGVLESADGEHWSATEIGARFFARAPGPFGIIEAYHPYMSRLCDTLMKGRSKVWVHRGANVAASQDANRGTFEQANNALDRFCGESGFEYSVFLEHAMGRGEAIRQRYARSGADSVQYFGADLEDEAIDAALAEKNEGGRLPANLRLIRNADIGRPEVVLEYLCRHNIETRDAVMMVGNGFHEVRDQSDEKMVAIFQAYCDAGILLLFTEASALSVDDLLETAWNTYHAGFKYVHEKSGQGLRPAYSPAAEHHQRGLRASWDECATRAGYFRLKDYSKRGRTIYPFSASDRYNPAISVNHFFIPQELAVRLGIKEH
jgi:hypothetical protein